MCIPKSRRVWRVLLTKYHESSAWNMVSRMPCIYEIHRVRNRLSIKYAESNVAFSWNTMRLTVIKKENMMGFLGKMQNYKLLSLF